MHVTKKIQPTSTLFHMTACVPMMVAIVLTKNSTCGIAPCPKSSLRICSR